MRTIITYNYTIIDHYGLKQIISSILKAPGRGGLGDFGSLSWKQDYLQFVTAIPVMHWYQ